MRERGKEINKNLTILNFLKIKYHKATFNNCKKYNSKLNFGNKKFKLNKNSANFFKNNRNKISELNFQTFIQYLVFH